LPLKVDLRSPYSSVVRGTDLRRDGVRRSPPPRGDFRAERPVGRVELNRHREEIGRSPIVDVALPPAGMREPYAIPLRKADGSGAWK
jgi:hypothetical protein